ncbi:MarR family winged helix-turn-helix transcriptional regulator [Streptomyces sp. NPDC059247]|uniref:MarR family winged helix-turn-helix transcriptional regulator n=1 Tax=Streptomyces sp. NPDC059247 TaxID=3346790 RepID=UPI0036A64B8A
MTGHRQPDPEAGPDLGVLSARILFSVQRELFATLAERGFDDILPRSGAVLAHLRPEGIRASELARLSGQHKQVVGTLVDDLERLGYVERAPDPADRRAKLVRPTERGLLQMETATAIMRAIEERHAKTLGEEAYSAFKDALGQVARAQSAAARELR